MRALYNRQQEMLPGTGGACSEGRPPERVARWGAAQGLWKQLEALLASCPGWCQREGRMEIRHLKATTCPSCPKSGAAFLTE